MTRRKVFRSWWVSRSFTFDGRAHVLLDRRALAGLAVGSVTLAAAALSWAASWPTVLVLAVAAVGVLALAATGARVASRSRRNRAAKERGEYYW